MGAFLTFFSRQIIIPKFVELPTLSEEEDNKLKYNVKSEDIIDIKSTTSNIIIS